jgi:hypothetical protein
MGTGRRSQKAKKKALWRRSYRSVTARNVNPKSAKSRIVFRKQARVGANDAEEDGEFLHDCFVDSGDLATLVRCDRPQRLVVGRTGAGKSALLLKLRERPRTIYLDPQKLALPYVSNSPILRFFQGIGINLDVFYKLLWRHCFCVELIKARFDLTDSEVSRMQKVRAYFSGPDHRRALKYLERWGDKFWEETDVRLREVTRKVEDSLQSSVATKWPQWDGKLATGTKISEEEREEIVQRAQKVINEVHARELAEVIDLVDCLFEDPQKPHYIVVDGLDGDWVDDAVKNYLIMGLLDTIKEFRRARHVKVIAATRVDLLQRVFQACRGPGFQEEKYDSLRLSVSWSQQELVDLLERRINHVLRDAYDASRRITVGEVLASSKGFSAVDFLMDRTFLRPRDVIAFFNECIIAAEGGVITRQKLEQAEREYSRSRLASLADEWSATYPGLDVWATVLLDRRTSGFKLGDIAAEDVMDRCVNVCVVTQADRVAPELQRAAESPMNAASFVRFAVAALCRTGLLLLKLRSDEKYLSGPLLTAQTIQDALEAETAVKIHPMFWAALHIRAH